MTAEDDPQDDPSDAPAEGHLGARRERRLRVSASGRTRRIPDAEQLKRIETRIRLLYDDGRIRVESGREIFRSGARETLKNLVDQRDVVSARLGPTRVFSGERYEIHYKGKAYSFSPYSQWGSDLLREWLGELPVVRLPTARRDRLIWFLWSYRHRASIQIGILPHNVPGGLVRCAGCGDTHRYLGRPRDAVGVSSCRRCGDKRHIDVTGQAVLKPFGPITKASLQRRFRLSRRQIDKILSVHIPS